jgi:hypothetical protein
MRSCRQPSAVTAKSVDSSEWYFFTVNRPPFSPAPFHRKLHEEKGDSHHFRHAVRHARVQRENGGCHLFLRGSGISPAYRGITCTCTCGTVWPAAAPATPETGRRSQTRAHSRRATPPRGTPRRARETVMWRPAAWRQCTNRRDNLGPGWHADRSASGRLDQKMNACIRPKTNILRARHEAP